VTTVLAEGEVDGYVVVERREKLSPAAGGVAAVDGSTVEWAYDTLREPAASRVERPSSMRPAASRFVSQILDAILFRSCCAPRPPAQRFSGTATPSIKTIFPASGLLNLNRSQHSLTTIAPEGPLSRNHPPMCSA